MHPVYIHTIETLVPETCYSQEEALQELLPQFDDKKAKRILGFIYPHSGIENRHIAVKEFGSRDPEALFHRGADGKWSNPGTGERNRVYAECSKVMSVALARTTLEANTLFSASDVTHLITASCTGFYNPGPDYHIIKELGLSPDTERFNLGFMGCYAAFPAMRLARQICQANPDAVVMIQCLELCSLHLQFDTLNPDALVSSALFGDGAGCALISARAPAPEKPAYELSAMRALLTGTGEEAMAWDVGNHGYDITLSSYVPEILATNIHALLDPFLMENGVSVEEMPAWAIHPGGRSILDKIRDALGLDESAIKIPRQVLREFGNMSSATILFVMKGLMDGGFANDAPPVPAMAFGPGLTVEMALLQPHPAHLVPPATKAPVQDVHGLACR